MAKEETIYIKIEPGLLMLVSVIAGFMYGLLMVGLDPWLRFPDVALLINWREALLTASVMGCYAALLSWTITTFWHSQAIWIVVLLMVPLVTGVSAAWNRAYAPFGYKSDIFVFLLGALVFHVLMVVLSMLYLRTVAQLPGRQWLAFTAIPVVLLFFLFFGVGYWRWSINQDAKDVVTAADRYADILVIDEEYKLEFLGIRYGDGQAPTGEVRVHAETENYFCLVRLFSQSTDISCRVEEE